MFWSSSKILKSIIHFLSWILFYFWSTISFQKRVIEQAVIDMQSDLVKIRQVCICWSLFSQKEWETINEFTVQSYAEITATQKKLEKQKEQALIVAADWYRRAQLALEKGDEELAREALSRRQTQLDSAENLSKQLTIQTNAVDKLYSSMTLLEQKISEAKRQKEASLNSILFWLQYS